ncbi:MAG: acetate--CoA ligase [Holosporales bacterium]|jgi:acetyl-CoA synthetase|nr:acetate--CoA ligase [Holosporales bacterium]
MKRHNKNPLYNEQSYKEWYKSSFQDSFWLEQAKRLDWIVAPTKANRSSFTPDANIRWFEDGTLNVCYNCVDRHLRDNANKTAIIFEPDEPGNAKHISYKELHENVCKLANTLKSLGVKKGDIVTLYLPMDPSIVYAMLACARIGAVHSVVFSGFAPHALAERLAQSRSQIIITKTTSQRGGRTIALKKNVDEAVKENTENGINTVDKILLMDDVADVSVEGSSRTTNCPCEKSVDCKGTNQIGANTTCTNETKANTECPCEEMSALDPLFVLYTSGSTGHPKGIIHSSGGYLVYAAMTHEIIFDLTPDDVYFCTADVGWITGHSYGVYGPLANGATLVLFQGVPTYPDASRFWKIIDEHKVSIFYTAPTALRSLMKMDDSFVKSASLQTLRILGSVGEPIDQATWQWFHESVGHGKCPVMDTWWQTETGGVLICPLLQNTNQKPGCAAKPFAGVDPTIVPAHLPPAEQNSSDPGARALLPLNNANQGALGINKSWPGQFIGILDLSMKGTLNKEKDLTKIYFPNGVYTSGDGAKMDDDGDIWILGRMDDVLNVSGHRLNSAELEQAVTSHPSVAEACVVGYPHEIKGQGIFVFAVLHDDSEVEKAPKEIIAHVRKIIGPIATPDKILLVPELPKTRSGKIVRRLLRKLAASDDVGGEDTSTLLNPNVIAEIAKLLNIS